MGENCEKGYKKTNTSYYRGTNKHRSMDEKRIPRNMYQPRRSDYYQNYKKEIDVSDSNICGIINLGNNCYLNSGLQIIASCTELVNELNNTKNSRGIIPHIKRAIYSLLNERKYNPDEFMNYFCSKNSDFIRGSQCCSQNFIRTLIRNINQDSLYQDEKVNNNDQYNPYGKEKIEYSNFIYGLYPESKMKSIFSGMTKSFSQGKCIKCHKLIENYSFSYFIDLNLYLNDLELKYRYNLSDVLNSNIGTPNNLSIDCPYCNTENNLKEETKIIKLPDILIFTLERYQGETNNVEIIPEKYLNMGKYIEKNLNVDCTDYELFAVNIRYGRTANFGHEICQVKREGQWYEINDSIGKKIHTNSHNDCSYGLFYRKRNNNQKYSKITIKNEVQQMEVEEEDNEYNKFQAVQDNYDKYKKDTILEVKDTNKSNKKKPENKNEIFDLKNNGGFRKTNPIDEKNIRLAKILNYNNRCKSIYSGLLIISLFDEFINEINKYTPPSKYLIYQIKNAVKQIINKKECETYDIKETFNLKNKNAKDFIIDVINKINEELLGFNLKISLTQILYTTVLSIDKEFHQLDKMYGEETKAKYIFAIISKKHLSGICFKCNTKINNISFNCSISKKLDFDKKTKIQYDFLDLIDENFKIDSKIEFTCTKCNKKSRFDNKNTIIKLPDILILTIARDYYNEKIKIKPDVTLDMKRYLDPSTKQIFTKYELFAVNIKNNDSDDCQIKINDEWYEVSEGYGKKITSPTFTNSSYGFYYKKIKSSH